MIYNILGAIYNQMLKIYTFKDEIDYVAIATQGNAVDFGNLTEARDGLSGISNAHGGLQKPIRYAILNRNRNNSFDNNV